LGGEIFSSPLKSGFTRRRVSDSSSNLFLIEASRSSKLLVLGGASGLPEVWKTSLRSLHIEHVSPGTLVSQEICRRSPLGQSAELAMQRGTPVPAEIVVALVRRWFMARKPDAGFALTGFPATLLQARILDEWLEARDESLDAVFAPSPASSRGELADYYRLHGLLLEEAVSSAFRS
jgi:adenylate kinase